MKLVLDSEVSCLYTILMGNLLLCSACHSIHTKKLRENGSCPRCEGQWYLRVGDPGRHLRRSLGVDDADLIRINRRIHAPEKRTAL